MATGSSRRRKRQKSRRRDRGVSPRTASIPPSSSPVPAQETPLLVQPTSEASWGTRSLRRRARNRARRRVDEGSGGDYRSEDVGNVGEGGDGHVVDDGDQGNSATDDDKDNRHAYENCYGGALDSVGDTEDIPSAAVMSGIYPAAGHERTPEATPPPYRTSSIGKEETPCPAPRARTPPSRVGPRGAPGPRPPLTRTGTSSPTFSSPPTTPCPSPRPRLRPPECSPGTPTPCPATGESSRTSTRASTPCPPPRTQRSPTRFYTPLSTPSTPAPEMFFTPHQSPTQETWRTPSPTSSAAVSLLLDSPDSPRRCSVRTPPQLNHQTPQPHPPLSPRTPRTPPPQSPHAPRHTSRTASSPTSTPTPTPLSPSATPSTAALSPLPTSTAHVASASTQPRSGLDSEGLDAAMPPDAESASWVVGGSDASAAMGEPGPSSQQGPKSESSASASDTDSQANAAGVWPRDVPLPLKGFHVSSDGGLTSLASRARALRAAIPASQSVAVQAFCGSPRRHALPALDPADARAFRDGTDTTSWAIHANHTTNLASADEKTALAGLDFVAREMHRCRDLGIPVLCVHLGSDVSAEDASVVVTRVARALRELLATVPGVTLALENMIRASACTQPWSLSLLARILDAVDDARAAVCVDICHAHIAEYDLGSAAGVCALERVLAHEVGWHRIAGFHVSDAATPHGRACEGHASIGDGLIPLSSFRRILRARPVLGRVPYYLETPAYAPSLRPVAFPAVAQWEAARHLAEWAFLERAICMPDDVWAARAAVEETRYRREKERCQLAIRNLLRPERALARNGNKSSRSATKEDAAATAAEAFRADRREALSRAAIVRRVREARDGLPSPIKLSPCSPDARAALEARSLAYAAFTTRGGYTMRRRAASAKIEW